MGKSVLFLHDESFIGRKRNVKGLSDKAFDEHVANGPLSFTFHINKGYDLIDIFPDKGPNIAHDAHAINTGLDRKREHFIGPG